MNNRFLKIIGVAALGIGLYLTSLYHYLLFHSLAELFSIVVAFSIFVISWNSKKYFQNDYFLLIGVAFLFIGGIDLLHTLSYKGMKIFRDYDDYATQFWIAARFLEALTLLVSFRFLNPEKRINPQVVFAGYFVITALTCASILYWKIFPICFVEGQGLTHFKIFSEYAICAILFIAITLLTKNRDKFDRNIYSLMLWSFIFTIASELAFTFYIDSYGLSNLIGHYAKIVAFFLIYRVIIYTGFISPYDLIFRDIKQTEEELLKAKEELEIKVKERTAELRDAKEKLQLELAERRRAEEYLSQINERFSLASHAARLGVWDWDIQRNELLWNDEMYSLYGIAREDFAGAYEAWLKRVHPDDRAHCDEISKLARLGELKYDTEFRVVWPDGSTHYLKAYGEIVRDADGRPSRMTGINFDFTALKLAEEALVRLNRELEQRVKERTSELEEANIRLQELDRLKSMFIASMSHELRTPLNSIIGFSSVLLNEWAGPMNSEQKANLAIIVRSGEHLLSLVNDVIDVSKIEAGNIESTIDDFDIYEVVAVGVSTLENDIRKKGIELKVMAIHQAMQTDKRRLLQCLLNLMSNAVKFTEKGVIEVRATIQCDGDMMEISVSDTGIGIKEEDMLELFSPFVRIDSPLQSNVLGTGLGLYLTNKLVREVLKGGMTVSSTYGEGSVFTLKVPITGPRT